MLWCSSGRVNPDLRPPARAVRQAKVVRSRSSSRSRRPLWWLLRLLAGVVLLMLAGFAWFIQSLPGPAALTEKTDGVAVLTGGPGRVARGVKVLQAGSAERLLISGVDRIATPEDVRKASGLSMAEFRCCVDLGFAAEDTRSNAAEVASFSSTHKLRSIRLVTASFHMPRARAEIAARIGPGVKIVEDGVPQRRSFWQLAKEYLKLLVSRALLLARPPR